MKYKSIFLKLILIVSFVLNPHKVLSTTLDYQYVKCTINAKIILKEDSKIGAALTVRVIDSFEKRTQYETPTDYCFYNYSSGDILRLPDTKLNFDPKSGQFVKFTSKDDMFSAVRLGNIDIDGEITLVEDYGTLPKDNPMIVAVNFFKDLLVKIGVLI